MGDRILAPKAISARLYVVALAEDGPDGGVFQVPHDEALRLAADPKLTAAQERIAELTAEKQRIVEAGDALADAATAVMNAKGEEEMIALDGLEESLFAYREAVGGES